MGLSHYWDMWCVAAYCMFPQLFWAITGAYALALLGLAYFRQYLAERGENEN